MSLKSIPSIAKVLFPTVGWLFSQNATTETLSMNPIAGPGSGRSVSGTISGGRNPYNQPGSNASVWNTPFGSGATWTNAYSAAICNPAASGPPCVGNINSTSFYGRTEYTSTSTSDGTYTFSSKLNGRTQPPDNGPTITATMHVPTGAITPGPYISGCDCSLILQDENSYPNRQYTWGQVNGAGVAPFGLQPGLGPFNAGQAEWDDITSDTYGQDYDTGLDGFNVGPGLINACDVTPSCNPTYPKIQHGLRFSMDVRQFASNAPGGSNVLNPSGWPDRLEDTQTGGQIYTGTLPFGYTLGIPSKTSMPSGLDANCQGLFWTMQHYPQIARDSGSGGILLTTEQIGDTSAFIASARSCLPTLVGLLQVLTNQHQGGQSFTTQPANGPGTRVDTGPVPLGGSGRAVAR
jgi:hypothetical protein